jgi:hypothetical protein
MNTEFFELGYFFDSLRRHLTSLFCLHNCTGSKLRLERNEQIPEESRVYVPEIGRDQVRSRK